MYFAPKVTEGTIAWTCHIDNVESNGNLVPKECRNEKPGVTPPETEEKSEKSEKSEKEEKEESD